MYIKLCFAHLPLAFVVPGNILQLGLSSNAIALLVHLCDPSEAQGIEASERFTFPPCIPERFVEDAFRELIDSGVIEVSE